MPTPKATTFQQKLGFFDNDLKDQTHDDILKWIGDNAPDFITEYYDLTKWNLKYVEEVKGYVKKVIEENKENIVSEIAVIKKQIVDNEETIIHYKICFKNAKEFEKKQKIDGSEASQSFADDIKRYKNVADQLSLNLQALESKISELNNIKDLGELPARKKVEVFKVIWEPPISTMNTNYNTGYKSSKYIIGFLDMKISFHYYKPTVSGIDFKTRKIIGEIIWAQTTRDININNGYANDYLTKTIYLEAKTKIVSLGELFRQLRTYKEYIEEDIIVVCPDNKDKELIINQGFGFYKYQGKL